MTLSTRTHVLHLGIVNLKPEDGQPDADRGLPPGMITDGDSFLTWGEVDLDHTLHVIVPGLYPAYDDVGAARSALAQYLHSGERLADCVVWTNPEDWAEDQHIVLLDGSTVQAATHARR